MDKQSDILVGIVHHNAPVFDTSTLSYCKEDGGHWQGRIKNIEVQYGKFSWLSYPGVGFLGCPFKAGAYFLISMTSGKTGVWLCVDERHDRSSESGELIAFFVGYKGEAHFYNLKELQLLMAAYTKVGLSLNNGLYPGE